MIGKLTGSFDSAGEDWAVIDCAGVGWLVHCSGRTLGRLQSSAGPVGLLVETRFREGEITLYGFWDGTERDWFRLLTTVQGVGGRVAQAILTVLSPDELTLAIAAEDKKRLTMADGVGPKLAGRIVSELRDRVGAIAAPVARPTGTKVRPATPPPASEDAVSALVNLGFARVEAFGAVARASQSIGDGATVEALVKAGLRELAG